MIHTLLNVIGREHEFITLDSVLTGVDDIGFGVIFLYIFGLRRGGLFMTSRLGHVFFAVQKGLTFGLVFVTNILK